MDWGHTQWSTETYKPYNGNSSIQQDITDSTRCVSFATIWSQTRVNTSTWKRWLHQPSNSWPNDDVLIPRTGILVVTNLLMRVFFYSTGFNRMNTNNSVTKIDSFCMYPQCLLTKNGCQFQLVNTKQPTLLVGHYTIPISP